VRRECPAALHTRYSPGTAHSTPHIRPPHDHLAPLFVPLPSAVLHCRATEGRPEGPGSWLVTGYHTIPVDTGAGLTLDKASHYYYEDRITEYLLHRPKNTPAWCVAAPALSAYQRRHWAKVSNRTTGRTSSDLAVCRGKYTHKHGGSSRQLCAHFYFECAAYAALRQALSGRHKDSKKNAARVRVQGTPQVPQRVQSKA
jgi:hypothetical protein